MFERNTDSRWRLEYAGMKVAYAALAWLPLPLSRLLAVAAADVWRLFDKKHRELAVDQSMDRLGIGKPEAEKLVRDNYRHYALLGMEVARLRRISLEELGRRTASDGWEKKIDEVLAQGKGLVLVTGHLGNWEWAALTLGLGKSMEGMIARPLDNPYIDEFLVKIRERSGGTVWEKRGAIRKAMTAVRKGKCVVAVIDQDGGPDGCRAPFLGKSATTMSAPVDMAIRSGAPLFVGAVMRTGPGMRFSAIHKRVHWPDPDADPVAERVRLVTEINRDIGEIIREYPEQWIWIHKRWKHSNGS